MELLICVTEVNQPPGKKTNRQGVLEGELFVKKRGAQTGELWYFSSQPGRVMAALKGDLRHLKGDEDWKSGTPFF